MTRGLWPTTPTLQIVVGNRRFVVHPTLHRDHCASRTPDCNLLTWP